MSIAAMAKPPLRTRRTERKISDELPADLLEWLTTTDADRLACLLADRYNTEPLADYIARHWPFHPLPRHLKFLVDLFERARHTPIKACVSLPPGFGKRIADSVPVFTPRGWCTHGDLSVGDDVYAVDGSITRVTYVSPSGPCDRLIRFSDGASVVAHGDHLWPVHVRGSGEAVLSTDEMWPRLHSGTCRNGKPRARFLLPYPGVLAGVHRVVPFEPYYLGVWLGDGTSVASRIAGTGEHNRIRMAELERRGHRIGRAWVQEGTGVHYFSVLSDKPKGEGLWGYFHGAKRIPEEYFTAEEDIRRDLLAGLVDSDSHVTPTGKVVFSNTNRALVDGCIELVRGLGYRASVTRIPPGGKGNLDCYAVQWTPHDGHPQGVARASDADGLRRRRSIAAIEECSPVQGRCIEVDHPSHVYLIGRELIPTHNTITIQRALCWWLEQEPADNCAFYSHGDQFARSKSVEIRELAEQVGMQLSADVANMSEWRTHAGGRLYAGGLQSGITGKRVTGVFVVDDPFKGEDAGSLLLRDKVHRIFNSAVMTRLEGASVIVVQTRWHEDDLIGRLAKQDRPKWEVYNLPAIAEEDDPLGRAPGESLWPEMFPVAALDDIRAQLTDWLWSALYQGRPRPKGHRVFGPAHYYEPTPEALDGHRYVVAVDPAASADTRADYSVAVVLAATGYRHEMQAKVVEVWRGQVEVPDLIAQLSAMSRRHGHCPIGIEGVGGFKSVAQMLKRMDPSLQLKPVKMMGADKFTRAQPVAAAWNSGRLQLPLHAPWLTEFVEEFALFTGVGDLHDDQVDALAHAWNLLDASPELAMPVIDMVKIPWQR